ncbi:TetR family transcriptional regulator C-terminal domain-containing protein [Microbacterium sp. NPDC058345]|uniref:TetR family transcriptional regulator C-terminal domain-containing protein n=1 Tax=Microbacterium sp. NPDC058345 TaxID=3346455 RepID=UPI00366847AC
MIDLVGDQTMAVERERLGKVDSFEGLQRWRDAMLAANAARRCRIGCSLGALVVDVSDQDELARQKLDDVFRDWRGLFEALLRRFRDRGLIPADADIVRIATSFIAAVQGGYLLARTAGDITPMASAIDVSIEYLRLLVRPQRAAP